VEVVAKEKKDVDGYDDHPHDEHYLRLVERIR
jgi:hypothetical protein